MLKILEKVTTLQVRPLVPSVCGIFVTDAQGFVLETGIITYIVQSGELNNVNETEMLNCFNTLIYNIAMNIGYGVDTCILYEMLRFCSRCLIWIIITILTVLFRGIRHILPSLDPYCPRFRLRQYESISGNICRIPLKASQYFINIAR